MTTIPTEHDEQVKIIAWARAHEDIEPDLFLLYAIPNGCYKSHSSARKFSAEGLKSGVPDLCLPVARGGFHSLYIELKRVTGGHILPQQKIWIEKLTDVGVRAVVCYGADEAIAVIAEYVGIEIDPGEVTE